MAEMDYSKVIEPDISGLRRPDPRCMTRVEQLIEQVGNIWHTRREVGRMLLDKCGGKWQRRKGIYYDEEGIREEQLETAHYCKNCSGYITVATNARGTRYGDQSAYVVCLLRDTCENCKKAAYDESKVILEDAKRNATKVINNALQKAERIESEAESLRRKVSVYKRRFRTLVEDQLDEMEQFDDRIN